MNQMALITRAVTGRQVIFNSRHLTGHYWHKYSKRYIGYRTAREAEAIIASKARDRARREESRRK